jgi:hypothetical protein
LNQLIQQSHCTARIEQGSPKAREISLHGHRHWHWHWH